MPFPKSVATVCALGKITLCVLGGVKFYSPLEFNFMTDGHMLFETCHGRVAFVTMRTLICLRLFLGSGGRGALMLILPQCAQHILQLLSCLVLPSNVLRIVSGNPVEFTQEVSALPCQGGTRILSM